MNHTEQPDFECLHVQNCGFVDYKGKKLLERLEMKQGEGYITMDPPKKVRCNHLDTRRHKFATEEHFGTEFSVPYFVCFCCALS